MIAVLSALATYRLTVVPAVRRELDGWRLPAAGIADAAERDRALESLAAKASNSEAVAVFAILAPRARRRVTIRAIVALQVAIDYLDTLQELGLDGDSAYLTQLFDAYRESVAKLPAHPIVLSLLERAVARCGEGQHRTHGAEHGDRAGLEAWARAQDAPPDYRWWEVAAGASSSVAAHALIAAAADPHTSASEAEQIDAAYHPSIGALTVFLDDLVDHEEDATADAHDYLAYYETSAEAADRLDLIARRATAAIAILRQRRRHAAILAGVTAFYLSAPEASSPNARPIRDRLLTSAGPAAKPIVVVMRRRQRRRKRPRGQGALRA